MPDRRKHRGRHPDDQELFNDAQLDRLRVSVDHLSWLLTRGYALDAALKLIGDHHSLTARQRMAVRRATCTDEARATRSEKVLCTDELAGRPLGIDGYNLLITIESALAGGLVFIARDGCYRDLAGVHGTYRKVEETVPALTVIIDALGECAISRIDWYLDRPVSNSGRLKTLIAETLADRAAASTDPAPVWNIELVNAPDRALSNYDGAVVTSDSVIVDRCGSWVNLARRIIERQVPDAWVIDLRALHDIVGGCTDAKTEPRP